MTSTLALKHLRSFNKTGDKEIYYKAIERDLEVLESLKPRINLKEDTIKGAHFIINEKGLPEIETDTTKDYDIAWIEASGFVFRSSEEYKLLKDWLKNN